MTNLKLLPGPRLDLTRWIYNKETGVGHNEVSDVTAQAGERLFQAVSIDSAVTLGDLFALLKANPILQTVFRQDYANELCAEADKGLITKDAKDEKVHERLEYLELYQRWSLDSETKESFRAGEFHLHGVGYVLDEDVTEDGSYVIYKKGDRIQWGISLTPVRELLHLPIRLNDEVLVCEDNLDYKKYGSTIQTLKNSHITLGSFIHAVLWELSWHGTPQESQEVSEGLREQMQELDAGTLETVSHEDVFESLGFTPQKLINEHFFESGEEFSASEIYLASHNLEDDELASVGLAKELEGRIRLRPGFYSLTGKGLRKAMREFRRETPKAGDLPAS